LVEQDGIRFLVRILTNLVRKDAAKKQQEQQKSDSGKEFNPFLPYEEDLFVTHLSDTHLCLLNKFNVVDDHLLIVTRAFEEQDDWLTLQDFEAMWLCLAEIDGLAFYNGGKLAGASQRHKHLQLVPLPFATDEASVPIETALQAAQFDGTVGISPTFPFVHAIAHFPKIWNSISEASHTTLRLYQDLLQAVGMIGDEGIQTKQQTSAYNLLVARPWMLLIPRSQADYETISVNALGFAGALLVRNDLQMQQLKDLTPMMLLQAVGYVP
jgi:ATP adenylyltransferase